MLTTISSMFFSFSIDSGKKQKCRQPTRRIILLTGFVHWIDGSPQEYFITWTKKARTNDWKEALVRLYHVRDCYIMILYYNLPVCYYCRRTFSSHFSVTHTTLQGAQHSALEKSTCPTRCNNVITLCVRQTPKPKSSLLPFRKYPTPSPFF